ncbi:MAG: rod shape-determining protein MreC [Treponema sp.]|uniref:rod shape-determining protein MreC n=1 Tax=Treponema sp. TaxID=166 RepID=UPI00298E546C|nr:rod shape-determining protein MreC [Treponema sp.]MCI5697356.1 rod shape-determining protein MreC [Spirochaetia bacterium]MDD5811727.1 rod shape-determining protein MreC [Treponema sp.]MDY5885401.1 rod shape-determining protein MreC [Treponema sp.]
MQKQGKSKFKFRFQELLFIILVVASSVMLSFSSGGFIINFKNVGFTIFSTIEKGVATVSFYVKDAIDGVVKLVNLSKEYDELTEKLKDYEYMQRTNAAIRKENARLKEQLGFADSIQQKTIPANIISRGADNLHTTLIIDKGSKDGIKKNMSVVAIQNGNIGVVGKVVSVGYNTAQIMNIFNSSCSISARMQNTRDIGLVTGNGTEDKPLSMKYIKKRVISELHFGDIVVTSGENGNYIKEIPIGTISKVSILDYDTSLDIEIEPVINFSRLESVMVVSNTEMKSQKEEKEVTK